MILVHIRLPVSSDRSCSRSASVRSRRSRPRLVVGNAPPDRAGAAAALSETGAELGGALGIALLGSLGARCTGINAGAIGDTLADAIARNLSADQLAGARLAYVHGFEITAVVGATILVVTAVGVVYWLRGREPVTAALAARQPRRDLYTACSERG